MKKIENKSKRVRQETHPLGQLQRARVSRRGHENGYTLIELLLYLAIASIMITVLVSFYILLLENKVKAQTIAVVEQEGVRAMNLITQTVRDGDNIDFPTQGNNGASLTVNAAGVANDPTVYALSGTTMQVTEALGAAIDLTSDNISVTSIDFYNLSQDDDAQNIKIEFTLEHDNPLGTYSYNYSKTFYGSATIRKK